MHSVTDTMGNSIPVLTYADPLVTLRTRLLGAVHITALGYPILLLLAFYGSYGMAWFDLGYRPRVGLDDPKRILGPLYFVSAGVVLALPLCAGLAVYSVLLRLQLRAPLRTAAWGIAIIAVWSLTFAVVRVDAYSVVNWWCD